VLVAFGVVATMYVGGVCGGGVLVVVEPLLRRRSINGVDCPGLRGAGLPAGGDDELRDVMALP